MQGAPGEVSEQKWICLEADDYRATLPVDAPLLYEGSHLATMVAMAVQCNRSSIRLNCSADVAREVVSVVRLADAYIQPSESRLLRAVAHQLDFLGVRLPQPESDTPTLLYISSFRARNIEDFQADPDADRRTEFEVWEDVNKVYMYDSRGPAGGWAQIVKEKSKWPEEMTDWHTAERSDGSWLSATLPYEYTSAGERGLRV